MKVVWAAIIAVITFLLIAVDSRAANTTVTLVNCSPAPTIWTDAGKTQLQITCQGTAPPVPQCPSPPGAGPCGGPISCSGFTKTLVIPMTWSTATRVITQNYGNFNPNDAVVVQFTTGNTTSSTGNLPRIVGAEWIDPLYNRQAVLSATPCDWSPQATSLATSNGTSTSNPFTVANPNNYGLYPILSKNTTYYLNIKNAAGSGCTAPATCNMVIDLYNAGAQP